MTRLMLAIAVLFASVFAYTSNALAYDDYTNVPIHMTQFDGESQIYTGYILFEDNSAMPIAFQNTTAPRYEDDVYTTSTGVMTVDMALNTDNTWGTEFNHNNHTFNWWKLTTNDTTLTESMDATPTSTASAKVNGYLAQMTGIFTNGLAIMLKDAGDPASCQVSCAGWMVQGSNLISFVYCDREDVPTVYKLYMPLVVSSQPVDSAHLTSVRIHHFSDGSAAYYAMLNHSNGTIERITITMNDRRPTNTSVDSLTDNSFVQDGVTYSFIVRS